MSRLPVSLRDAEVTDAAFLVRLWEASIRPAPLEDQVAVMEQVIRTAAASPDQRLVLAEFGGARAGAVLLCATTLSPLNVEPTVHVHSPRVLEDWQRKGVGHALMDAAVSFAEERGIQHVAAVAGSGSREGNRYLARLAFGPKGILRYAATATVRAKLNAQRPVVPRSRVQLGQVLAARRSMRRHEPVA